MAGGLLTALSARMRRAALVLALGGLIIGAGAFIALAAGLATTQGAAGVLALSIVLIVCSAVLFGLYWLGRSSRRL